MSGNINLRDVAPSEWIDESSTVGDIERIVDFLFQQGTFHFPVLNNGLFPAAASTGADFEASGYHNVWVRDNVQVAFAHFRVGRVDVAVRCMKSLAEFFSKHRFRLENAISGIADFEDPMARPHIRFNGTSLSENSEKWAHAQNDAIGYFLWFYGVLVAKSYLSNDEIDWGLISLIVHYLEAIRYWEDEDSGHWEETRKVSASSIGVVMAALSQWISLLSNGRSTLSLKRCLTLADLPSKGQTPFQTESSEQVNLLEQASFPVTLGQLERLFSIGRDVIDKILPFECVQSEPNKNRQFDGALIFLCYPLGIVDRNMADQILDNVANHLTGTFGIRRYQGDSYWCANYKDLLSADQRSSDFSEDLSARDRLLQSGTEAQWCIFDPAISCAFGERFAMECQQGQMECHQTLVKQLHHLQRSLAQLTRYDHPSGPFRCPESYYLQQGTWVPNDLTPLLWTQANLLQALWWYGNSLGTRNLAVER